MLWLLLAAVGLVASFWLQWRYKHRRMLKMAEKLPGPPCWPGLGNAMQFICQPEEVIHVFQDMLSKYGDIIRFWLGPDLNIIVNNPDDVKELLSNPRNSTKGPQYKYMEDVLGGGILSGSGPLWRKHRKLANPNYGKRAIDSYGDVFNSETRLLLEKCRAVPAGQQFNVYRFVVQATSYSVCQTLMGLSKEQTMNLPHIQNIIDCTPQLYNLIFDRMTKWYLQINPVFRMSHLFKDLSRYLQMTVDFSQAIIENRLDYLKKLKDSSKLDLVNSSEEGTWNVKLSVIDRFILSGEMEKEELLKETFTIFTSSQEASAKITSFTLLMMAYHPDCQEKLYNEIKSVMGDVDRPVTKEDLKLMPYLEMVFKEVLRLFPIGALLQRRISEDIVISSGTLPAGSSLVVPMYHLHRDPRFWKDPNAFDPERFNPENTKLRHPNCYFPFSMGPMDCLGRYFGTKLIKTICVRVLREFEVTSTETYKDLRLTIAISADSVNGYNVALKPRRNGLLK
uniref:Cytochrome P450 monooxygenase CYP367B12 n=1 Tax=Cnaphalocrocis medinalis TaxID=437488 RepID=A0A0C5C1K7_CNAME|nr:cytochrome P450 monooxygenase CYP367B12 [Cnaphalocrocis medinalis]